MSETVERLPRATPVSRILRLLLGMALVGQIASGYASASGAAVLRMFGVIVLLVVLYTILHWLVDRHLSGLNPWIGALLAVAPAVALFLVGGAFDDGVIAFIGLSLIVTALLAHPGCEVLAFPALILGRRTHLACLLFTPLDWLEGKLTRRARHA